jgi:hypothetical protein
MSTNIAVAAKGARFVLYVHTASHEQSADRQLGPPSVRYVDSYRT